MSCFAGLDISTAFTAICIVDADGAVVGEATVDSTPEAGNGLSRRRRGSDRAHRPRSLSSVGMAIRKPGGGRLSGGLSGDAPPSGAAEERDQQDRPQRCQGGSPRRFG